MKVHTLSLVDFNDLRLVRNTFQIMADARRFYDCHEQLIRWQDELEFLCYILCELVCPDDLERIGFECHQAVDLPSFIKVIESVCGQRTCNLANAQIEAAELQKALQNTKAVRNAAAHHHLFQQETLWNQKDSVQNAIQDLERLIKSVAAKRHVRHIEWYPYAHGRCWDRALPLRKAFIDLNNGSLLAARQAILDQIYGMREVSPLATLGSRFLGSFEKAKASRAENIFKQWDSMMQAQKRRIQRIEENYRRACQNHDAQLQELLKRKRNIDTEYRNQMRNVLGYELVEMTAWQAAVNDLVLFIGLSSPIWSLISMLPFLYSCFQYSAS